MSATFKLVVRGIFAFSVAVLSLSARAMDKSPAPEGAELYIVSPADGDTVKSPVTVIFGLAGMGVAPAGVVKSIPAITT